MRFTLLVILLISIMLSYIVPVSAEVQQVELFVSVNGNDSNPGTESKPLATFDGARMAVKNIIAANKNSVPITVWFREGTYRMNKTVMFDQNDSGTVEAPITYSSYKNEKVTFSGSSQLNPREFQPLTDEALISLLPTESKDKVFVLDLKKQGITDIPAFNIPNGYGTPTTGYTEIFLDNKNQPMSRWPTTGYAITGKVIDKGDRKRPAVFKYLGKRPERWANAKNAVIEGYFQVDYASERLPLDKVDVENRTIYIGMAISGSTTLGEDKRFTVYNLFEEINSPGQWYIDRDKLLLYYYPPYTLRDTKLEISVLKSAMVKAKDLSNVNFIGLEFEQTCDNAFDLKACTNITIGGCTITNIGRTGVEIQQGTNNNVIGCDISNIGVTGVILNGGDRQTLTAGNNKVINCDIYNFAIKTKSFAYAVELGGVDNIIEHNLMHEGPQQVIRFVGNGHKIRYNEIYNAVKEVTDAGAIYAGRDWSMYGTEISYNYFHDIKSNVSNKGLYASAIYLDDMFSGTNVHHNVIKDTNLGFLLGGGLNNNFENNMLINCDVPIVADNRGEGWGKVGASAGGNMEKTLFAVPYNQPPYTIKYPLMAHTQDIFPGIPRDNVIMNNIMVNSGSTNINESVIKYGKVKDNISISADPGFVNPTAQDYGIKQGSEILKQLPNFSDLAMDKIGLVVDEYRKSIEKPKFSFKQIEPYNGQAEVGAQNCLFQWDAVPFADKYKIIIAEDSELKKVVYQGETVYNFITVNELQSGNNSYYWKVEAFNTSKQLGTNVLSRGQPYLLSTTTHDILDLTEIELSIKAAKTKLDAIVEGALVGQYKEGAKAEFEKVINATVKTSTMKNGTQKQIGDAVKALADANVALSSKMIKGYVGIENMLKSTSDWNATEDSVKINKDVLTFADPTNRAVAGFIKEPMNGSNILCFKMKANLNGSWMGLTLKQNKTEGIVWDGRIGYLIVIKSNVIELQRYNGGSSFLSIVNNTVINDAEWHDIQIGTLNQADGVLIVFKVDGKTVFSQLDTEKPITDDGYFTLHDVTKGGSISIMPTDNLPTDNLDNATVSYSEPVEQNIGEFLQNQKLWNAPGGNLTFNADGSATFADISQMTNILACKNLISNNSILNMRAKFNLGDKWQALGIRSKTIKDVPWKSDSPDGYAITTGGYLLAIKPNSIELQRWNYGNQEFIGIVDNKYIKSDEWCDIQLAAYDVIGGVQLLFKVNGQTVFEYLDPTPITKPGYFMVYDFNGANVDIAPANN